MTERGPRVTKKMLAALLLAAGRKAPKAKGKGGPTWACYCRCCVMLRGIGGSGEKTPKAKKPKGKKATKKECAGCSDPAVKGKRFCGPCGGAIRRVCLVKPCGL